MEISMEILGVGPRNPLVMFVGEKPDAEAMLMQRPFAGLTEQLLLNMLKQAGIERGEVYLTYAIKSRDGTPGKSKQALLSEVADVAPKHVIAMGKVPEKMLSSIPGLIPWKSLSSILMGSKKLVAETVKMLQSLKENHLAF